MFGKFHRIKMQCAVLTVEGIRVAIKFRDGYGVDALGIFE